MPLPELACTAGMVFIGLVYTLLSGLYGVVFTDLVQMILLTFTAIYVSVEAYAMRGEITLPDGFLNLDLEVPQGLGAGLMARDPGTWEPILSMFGLCVMMWVVRTMMEGMGGVGGYTDQRFFAARTEREAGLLTLESIVLSVFRWTMVAGSSPVSSPTSSISTVRKHFWTEHMRLCGGSSRPRKYGVICCMPAVVSKTVGSLCGTRDDDGTSR